MPWTHGLVRANKLYPMNTYSEGRPNGAPFFMSGWWWWLAVMLLIPAAVLMLRR